MRKTIVMATGSFNRKLESSAMNWLIGNGQMAEVMRSLDWSQTDLGSCDQWPASLRLSVNAMLSSQLPTAIAWGKQLTLLYNDAFLKIIGDKHPSAIGQPIKEAWPESWSLMKHDFDQVILRHEPIFLSKQKVSLRFQNSRGSHIPLSMFEYPIFAEDGQVGGVNISLIDTSEGRSNEESFIEYEKQFHLMRIKAEDAMRESESIYRAIGESLDYGIWICDSEGRNIYASQSFLKLVGLTQEQCSKFGWGNVLHPDDAERTISAWKKCVLTGEKWNIEHRFRGVDGKWHPVLARGIAVRNEQGKITAWAGINLDISDFKQVENKLKESEEKFRTMFDAIPQLAWMAHPDGFIFLYNKRWYEYTGTTPEEMEGWGWQSMHDPQILPNVLERWKEAISTGQPFEMEFPLRGGDGKFRWFLTRILPLKNSQGEVVRWFGTNTNISELKQVEDHLQRVSERLSLATHAAKIGIWDWDLRTNQLVWNDQMYELYGISSSQFSGAYEAWENSVHPNDLSSALQDLQKALDGEADFNSEFRVIWPDGSIHHIQALGVLKKDKSGQPVRMIGTNWDISERKKMENDLRAAIDLRDEFMSIASHELKTPLTALSMQIQLLMQTSSVEAANVLSVKAYKSIQSLVSLVNDLLDVTRIRVGKLTIEKQEMDLKEAANKVISLIQEESKSKGIPITLKASQPVIGRWDPKRIDQVLSNLLSNAIKYGEGKPIEIILTAHSDSNFARILVKDYGMGIPKEMQPKIFERFQRAVSGSSIAGLGLGLYITRQIIEAHAGFIRVESEVGKGSTFIVELPLNL